VKSTFARNTFPRGLLNRYDFGRVTARALVALVCYMRVGLRPGPANARASGRVASIVTPQSARPRDQLSVNAGAGEAEDDLEAAEAETERRASSVSKSDVVVELRASSAWFADSVMAIGMEACPALRLRLRRCR
jgi:hypothetical protein